MRVAAHPLTAYFLLLRESGLASGSGLKRSTCLQGPGPYTRLDHLRAVLATVADVLAGPAVQQKCEA